ncbi:hypothetical protein [uncultured Clostridium sp.]|uniref:hypothetical protein n=1 Tax=uncultured Clostridium sp. TaxID=59620 RepID=UPI0026DA986B|nr:hypothetical protein [uncultured Clostridium sp.]
MKKKLLSLVLAGAMVASTSVSAFADGPASQTETQIPQTPTAATGQKKVDVTDTEGSANIEIEGKIADDNNKLPASTISITVPTNASFTVGKNGKLIGSTITITSQSTEEVEVMAHEFTDSTGDEEIKVVSSGELELENKKSENADRKMVSLSLKGKKTVSLITASNTNSGKNGIYGYNTTTQAGDEEKKLGTVTSNEPLVLNLEGEGVVSTHAKGLDAPVKDTFTLTLKFKKKVQP